MPFRTFEVENENDFVNLLQLASHALKNTLKNEITDVGIAYLDSILAHLLDGMSGLIKETNPPLQHGIERQPEIARILFHF